jgi:hypothetical protein
METLDYTQKCGLSGKMENLLHGPDETLLAGVGGGPLMMVIWLLEDGKVFP